MATATTIRLEGRSVDNVALFEFLQGEAGNVGLRVSSDGTPQDLTDWTVRVVGEWYTGTVIYGTTPSIAGLVKVADRSPIDMTVTVADQSAEAGRASFYIPADFWTENIPLAEGSAAANTPMFQATVYYKDAEGSPNIVAQRIWIVMRRGFLPSE